MTKRKPKLAKPVIAKKPPHRPTKWYPEINQEMKDYFSIAPFEKEKGFMGAIKLVPNRFPTFEQFAWEKGVDPDTIVEWAKPENKAKYPDFSASYRECKLLQRQFLHECTANKAYDARWTIFFAKNITDLKDIQAIEHTGANGGAIQIANLDIKNANKEELAKFFRDKFTKKTE